MVPICLEDQPRPYLPVSTRKPGKLRQGGGPNTLGMQEEVRKFPRHACIHLDVSPPGDRAYQYQSTDVEVELTHCRMYGKFFVAGTILRIYKAAYMALAMANSSERRAAVLAIMLVHMSWLVSIITMVLLHIISLTSFTVLALRTRTGVLLQYEALATPPCNPRQRGRLSRPDCRPSLARFRLLRP